MSEQQTQPGLRLVGELCEMGNIDGGSGPGLRIRLPDDREVTVMGLTREEVRECGELFMDRVYLSVIA